jgi:hypothetical protein
MSSLKIEFPTLGWKQMLTSRMEILDAYDRAREQSRAHEIETYHGNVAEAACRKWLLSFLPKRFGVTSGYIISPGLPSSAKAPHFDVIIYDQLESPVLWVEESADTSPQGRSLAIPVEFVRAVVEVKSQLTTTTVKKAIEHLRDLSPLMGGVDAPGERYKLHLPANFTCGAIFVELRKESSVGEQVLSSICDGASLRGFLGGAILRGEGHTLPQTGRLSLAVSQTPFNGSSTLLLESGLSSTRQISENTHLAAMLQWSEAGFSQFAFDLIALMQGTYEAGRISSFYGLGSSFTEMMRNVGAKSVNS